MENPMKMDDLGVPLFSETSIYLPEFGLFVAGLSLMGSAAFGLDPWFFSSEKSGCL